MPLAVQLITIFPEIFSGFLSASLVGKARSSGALTVEIVNPRDFAAAPHFKVDDTPYGGGAGMVMKPEPLACAIEKIKTAHPNTRVVYLSPSGAPFSQQKAGEYAAHGEICLLCGRYEGVDQRVIDECVDEEICIGDYVLMGGEVAAMAVIESALRLIPNVLGNEESLSLESFTPYEGRHLLEGPQYTKPAEFHGRSVPEILLSGNHRKIAEWRKKQSLDRTRNVRPDLLAKQDAPDLSVVLLHEDMADKQGKLVTTSLTMIDVHDIAPERGDLRTDGCVHSPPRAGPAKACPHSQAALEGGARIYLQPQPEGGAGIRKDSFLPR